MNREEKKSQEFLNFFLNFTFFRFEKKSPQNQKFKKKNSVQHLKIHLRLHSEKIRHFELLEPKNLWYTTSTCILFDYFPEEPV